MPWKRAQRAYDRLDVRVEQRKQGYMVEHSKTLPCKANCFQCCRAEVLSTEAEGMLFANYLQRVQMKLVDAYKEHFEQWYRNLVAAELHQEVSTPRQYHQGKVWCPLLDKDTGTCREYDMRPTICRTHHSVNVEDCSEWQTTEDGLETLYTDDLLEQPMVEMSTGRGTMQTVSYWQFWVGKHLGCSFADRRPPVLKQPVNGG